MLKESKLTGTEIVLDTLQDEIVHLEDTQTLGFIEQKGDVRHQHTRIRQVDLLERGDLTEGLEKLGATIVAEATQKVILEMDRLEGMVQFHGRDKFVNIVQKLLVVRIRKAEVGDFVGLDLCEEAHDDVLCFFGLDRRRAGTKL